MFGWGCAPAQRPPEESEPVTEQSVLSAMAKAFDWQIENIVYSAPLPDGGFQDVSDTEWVRGAFFAGVAAAYDATGDPRYRDAVVAIGETNSWQPGPRPRHADDHCIAQSYVRLYRHENDPRMIEAIVGRFDEMIAEPRPGPVVGWSENDNWSWCDALFMAPPVMAMVGAVTGESRYVDLMSTMWWETYDYLYDREEHLWFRDGNFVIGEDGSGPRTSRGQKIFWSRGNGWVFGGLALVLDSMPPDYPERPRFEKLFREMASVLVLVQNEDGLWRSSLLDPEEFPQPESSGSGFFTFGLAWGVNNGLLDSDIYLPAVYRGWRGLLWAQQPDGRLGWVQQIGYDPRSVAADDSMEYATGAFLLAGSEMLRLTGE
jgi:rhamnogalacturonyl hydrolase YesR